MDSNLQRLLDSISDFQIYLKNRSNLSLIKQLKTQLM